MEVRKMPRRLTLAAAFITTAAAGLAAVPAASAHAIPLQVGPTDITHIGMPGLGSDALPGATTVESTNWSGYALNGSTYKTVSTSWVQPAVSCPAASTSYAAFWAGLDGYSSSTVEQDGTLAECVTSGGHSGRGGRGSQPTETVEYIGWYETYPNPMYQLGKTVSAGDDMTATVTANTSKSFTLTLTDQSANWTASTTQTLRRAAALSSAEVIAEAPSGSGGILPLANFGNVTFSSSLVGGVALNTLNPIGIDMITSRGAAEATTEPFSGDDFTVDWNS